MAKTIPHRELRNSSSRVLREVEAGASFEITNHGTVVCAVQQGRIVRSSVARPTTASGQTSDPDTIRAQRSG